MSLCASQHTIFKKKRSTPSQSGKTVVHILVFCVLWLNDDPKGHNYIGHNYTVLGLNDDPKGHNYIGHDYMRADTRLRHVYGHCATDLVAARHG